MKGTIKTSEKAWKHLKSFIQRFLNHCLPKFIRFEFSPSKRMKKKMILGKKRKMNSFYFTNEIITISRNFLFVVGSSFYDTSKFGNQIMFGSYFEVWAQPFPSIYPSRMASGDVLQ